MVSAYSLTTHPLHNTTQEQLLSQIAERYSKKIGFWMAAHEGAVLFFLEPLCAIEIVRTGDSVQARTTTAISSELKSSSKLEALDELFLSNDKEAPLLPTATFFVRYEACNLFEEVPPTMHDRFPLLPLAGGFEYRTVIALHKDTITVQRKHAAVDPPLWSIELDALLDFTSNAAAHNVLTYNAQRPTTTLTKEQYCDRIIAVQEAIQVGNVYQVNLSQQFITATPADPFAYYLRLRERAAPTHGCFFSTQCGTTPFALSCASPELFFNVRGNTISCSPIKGTRARVDGGSDLEESKKLKSDSKERAELSMIVDLVRNDLGKICTVGSVHVKEHARVTPLSYLYHLVSDITGELQQPITLSTILAALFPCASITGAPKIAAMKYISLLEEVSRGLYTGAVGFGHAREITCAVAIRTAQHYGDTTIVSAGGGITIDSDPEREYQECLTKGAIFNVASNERSKQ